MVTKIKYNSEFIIVLIVVMVAIIGIFNNIINFSGLDVVGQATTKVSTISCQETNNGLILNSQKNPLTIDNKCDENNLIKFECNGNLPKKVLIRCDNGCQDSSCIPIS